MAGRMRRVGRMQLLVYLNLQNSRIRVRLIYWKRVYGKGLSMRVIWSGTLRGIFLNRFQYRGRKDL
jgi:hypothetical protein